MTLLNYNTRLSILSSESLQTRRLYADLIYVYKILLTVVDVDSNVFFKLCNTFISRQTLVDMISNYMLNIAESTREKSSFVIV